MRRTLPLIGSAKLVVFFVFPRSIPVKARRGIYARPYHPAKKCPKKARYPDFVSSSTRRTQSCTNAEPNASADQDVQAAARLGPHPGVAAHSRSHRRAVGSPNSGAGGLSEGCACFFVALIGTVVIRDR
jgi:hypothetical protein